MIKPTHVRAQSLQTKTNQSTRMMHWVEPALHQCVFCSGVRITIPWPFDAQCACVKQNKLKNIDQKMDG